MYLIAGLGNPGRRYGRTRHNAGFLLVEALARQASVTFESQGDALVAECVLAGRRCLLAKPQTYMNLSGRSVKGLVAEYAVEPDRLLVVYDEAALPLGVIRFRPRGSAGGHKGMRSVIELLGTPEIPRLRIGVGDPESEPEDLSDYVLERFSAREMALLEDVLQEASAGVEVYLAEGIERAMARHNTRKPPQQGEGN